VSPGLRSSAPRPRSRGKAASKRPAKAAAWSTFGHGGPTLPGPEGYLPHRRMVHLVNGVRIALMAIDGFVALTAIGGGIALATGLEAKRFPWTSIASRRPRS
jgi:hypothetical protein